MYFNWLILAWAFRQFVQDWSLSLSTWVLAGSSPLRLFRSLLICSCTPGSSILGLLEPLDCLLIPSIHLIYSGVYPDFAFITNPLVQDNKAPLIQCLSVSLPRDRGAITEVEGRHIPYLRDMLQVFELPEHSTGGIRCGT